MYRPVWRSGFWTHLWTVQCPWLMKADVDVAEVSSRRLSCNTETPSAELSPGPRDQHVVTFSQTEMRPTGDVSDKHADMSEVGRASRGHSQKATMRSIRWRTGSQWSTSWRTGVMCWDLLTPATRGDVTIWRLCCISCTGFLSSTGCVQSRMPGTTVTGRLAPAHLTDDIQLVGDSDLRQLWSGTDRTCLIPHMHNFWDPSFTVAGPRICNSLPSNLRQDMAYEWFK